MVTRKIDNVTYEKIVKELCPTIPSDEIVIDDMSHEFAFLFRLIMLNLPNFEVEIQLVSF